ncbi:MAG: hypothetical protein DRP45_08250 [Candidatus Zixiibacteriota bacterium]|nr:MAG: hypothetical protein DRP45_08250 [candidate division Zixibacteria bacterium]
MRISAWFSTTVVSTVVAFLLSVSVESSDRFPDGNDRSGSSDTYSHGSSSSTVIKGDQIRKILFTENNGQWDDVVRFRAEGAGATVWFTDGIVYSLFCEQGPPVRSVPGQDVASMSPPDQSIEDDIQYLLVKTSMTSDPLAVTTRSEGDICSRSHFFKGNHQANWFTDVPCYGSIIMEDVQPGVSVRFYSAGTDLEFDFVVDPEANPSVAEVTFEGIETLHLDENGDLIITTAWGEIREHRLVVYQEINGVRELIPAEFDIRSASSYGFVLNADYDESLPLIIDPVLSFCTYLGGGVADVGYGVAIDGDGCTYVAGTTASVDFPDTNAYQGTMAGGDWDAFVAKYSVECDTLFYSSYLGGTDSDYAYGIDVDGSGSPYLIGVTSSADFPTMNPIQPTISGSDAFVTKFTVDGSALDYSTYLGGSDSDYGWAINVDNSLSAYITGYTLSLDFPTVGPAIDTSGGSFDVFVSKINSAGSALTYSTYLGGEFTDIAQDIVVDASGRAYVVGYTTSSLFPATVNAYMGSLLVAGRADMFITRLGATGAMFEYSSYLGGYKSDFANGIDIGTDGSMYILGWTYSNDFPLVGSIQGSRNGDTDLTITKMNAPGNTLIYSTYLGGSQDEVAGAVDVDDNGQAYVIAHTSSDDFPNVNAFQTAYAGGDYDVVVFRINSAGSELDYSTYLGGTLSDMSYGIAVDNDHRARVVGQTESADFPVKRPLQAASGGNADAFVALITGVCTDQDEDGICDADDNCPTHYNPLQENSDMDLIGDSCDVCPFDPDDDIDEDGYCADADNCPTDYNPLQEDPDLDGVGTACDNCPDDLNPLQEDTDEDLIGDSCDVCPFDYFNDYDGDGICGDIDNCPGTYNPDQLDSDENGVGDACEGCCVGSTGNVDCGPSETADGSDLSYLIDHLFIHPGTPLCCLAEGNIDSSVDLIVDGADLSLLIDHLFIHPGNPLPPCL